jgi:hypothetical protein
MKYAIATLQSAAAIVKMIVAGTFARLTMILILIASDVGMWLVALAYLGSRL